MTQDSKFIFSRHEWNAEKRTVKFFYKAQKGSEAFNFVETLSLPLDRPISTVPDELLKKILDNLSIIIGISYYKLFCPREIVLENMSFSKEQTGFWNTVYTKGLGEFFYNNEIDFRGLVNFPFSDSAKVNSLSFPRKDRSLVGIGGGKDSIVAGEMLKELKKNFSAFIVNKHPIKEQTAKTMGADVLMISKAIDPKLFELNKRSDTYNGHVPFSAMLAFISVFTGLLYDYKFAVFGNEESANYGNVNYLGEEMNHQWSKSFEFERIFQDYVKKFITPDFTAFSILRPLREIAVAKKFADYPQYFPVFSSCNKNFKMIEVAEERWCGECAKCAFVFLMLTAFLPKEKILAIFGEDLLAKETLLSTYKELLGTSAFKPFDCVGTPEEVKVAFYLAMKKRDYENNIVMKFFKAEVLPKIADIENLEKQVFSVSKEHRVPEEFRKIIQ